MPDVAVIKRVVSAYFKGLHEGNAELVAEQFAHEASIQGYYEGERVDMRLKKYIEVLKRMSAPNRLGEEFDMQIVSVEQVGAVAGVRTHYLFQALRYDEFLALLKIDGKWKIVGKTFCHS